MAVTLRRRRKDAPETNPVSSETTAKAPETPDPRLIQPLHLSPIDMMVSWVYTVAGALAKADKAYRENRQLATMMRHDADVLMAMKIREYAVTGLEWHVEPEDPENAEHRAEAAALEAAVRRITRLRQMMGHLERAFWYGSTAVSLQYERHVEPVIGTALSDPTKPESDVVTSTIHYGPVGFLPIHADAMAWTKSGELVIRTHGFSNAFEPAPRVMTPDGYGVILTEPQRASVVVNKWGIEAPDFDDALTADRPFAGTGLRNWLWYDWMNKQHITQTGAHYAERLARGMAIAFYQGPEGKAGAQELLKAMSAAYAATAPWDSEIKDAILKIVEPTGTGHQIFRELADIAAKRIIKAILHQELVTQTGPTGLGSGVAEAHQNTFDKVVDYDANCLEDSLTVDLLRPLQLINWGHVRNHRLCFTLEGDVEDADAKITRADTLLRNGVELAEQELREIGGFRTPAPGEKTVGGEMQMSDVEDLAQKTGIGAR